MTARSIGSFGWRLAEGSTACCCTTRRRRSLRWLIKSCCVLLRIRVGRLETPALVRLLHRASRYGFDPAAAACRRGQCLRCGTVFGWGLSRPAWGSTAMTWICAWSATTFSGGARRGGDAANGSDRIIGSDDATVAAGC